MFNIIIVVLVHTPEQTPQNYLSPWIVEAHLLGLAGVYPGNSALAYQFLYREELTRRNLFFPLHDLSIPWPGMNSGSLVNQLCFP